MEICGWAFSSSFYNNEGREALIDGGQGCQMFYSGWITQQQKELSSGGAGAAARRRELARCSRFTAAENPACARQPYRRRARARARAAQCDLKKYPEEGEKMAEE